MTDDDLRLTADPESGHNPSRNLKDFAMPRSSREAARSLRDAAGDQGGYFTAKASGYDYPHLEYHVSTGAFERIGNERVSGAHLRAK
jgi:hypothetical protein